MATGETSRTSAAVPIKTFGPLSFDETDPKGDQNSFETTCLLCEDTFNLTLGFKIFLQHIFEVHHLVIEDVQYIENLPKYIGYWREKLCGKEIESVVPAVRVEGTGEKYFLFSSLIGEDKLLRHEIRLEHILKLQETERTNDDFKKPCLFCKLNFEGKRYDYIDHLSTQHNLQLGNPQNLVYIDELINCLEEQLQNLRCVYCKKTFPDRIILKEHMRKKLHKRINPQNKNYDKYYVVNYLELGKTWESIEKEPDVYPIRCDANSDEEYSDWNEKDNTITCLLCDYNETNFETLLQHMIAAHRFNFVESTINLNFYQRVKLVNYMRRQILNNRCICCDEAYDSNSRLLVHIKEQNHNKTPKTEYYDQPEFYFPTYENDTFLYLLEDTDD